MYFSFPTLFLHFFFQLEKKELRHFPVSIPQEQLAGSHCWHAGPRLDFYSFLLLQHITEREKKKFSSQVLSVCVSCCWSCPSFSVCVYLSASSIRKEKICCYSHSEKVFFFFNVREHILFFPLLPSFLPSKTDR